MRMRYQVLLFSIVSMGLNTATRMVYPFLAVFARGLGIGLPALSLAITVRSAAGFLSPFLAALAEPWGRKKGMLVGVAGFIVSNLLVVIFPTYPVFFISLSLTFLSMHLYISSMQAYLGDSVAYNKRGMAIGFAEIGWALSFIIGMPIVGFFLGRVGWYGVYPFLVVFGIFVYSALWRFIPNSAPEKKPSEEIQYFSSLRIVFTSPSAIAGLFMSLFIVASNQIVNLVFGLWLEDSFGLKIAALGAAASVIGFAELSGELAGGGLTDRLGKKRSIIIALVLNGVVALLMPWLGKSMAAAFVCLFFFYLTFEFAIISALTMMSEVLPSARAALMGTNIAAHSLGRMVGTMVAPLLYVSGFQFNAAAVLALNLLAVFALQRVRISE
jgi:predicted MFS family arabinose efflux permease